MDRGYQYGFSDNHTAMFDYAGRQRKARTMVKVLTECSSVDLSLLSVLNVGGSSGIIDEYLSRYFKSVVCIDIDEKAINYAKMSFQRENIRFLVDDGMNMSFDSNSFDVIICSQVYEHVENAFALMDEIYRVLKPGGLVYFAAGNRIMLNEPHYNLPFLSILPRPLSHFYLRFTGRGRFYYEKHFTYWGLRRLTSKFERFDYTCNVISDPSKYCVDYVLRSNSFKHKLAKFLSVYAIWVVPGYIWVLRKPN